LPDLRTAAASLPGRLGEPLELVLAYLDSAEPSAAAAHYVETFDLRRRCCLYLSYYTHGDTRRRGLALLAFRRVYRAAGLQISDGELPDHLAAVLEFSAAGHTDAAVELLVANRAGVELLWRALVELGTPYAHAVAAVRASLPPAGPGDLKAARELAEQGPPVEQVGLASPALTGDQA
jgi:nitrate reductase delta subunit